MRMHVFKSPQKDLEKKAYLTRLDVIQKQLRDLRDDNQIMNKKLDTIVKGMALMVSAPEPEEIEDI